MHAHLCCWETEAIDALSFELRRGYILLLIGIASKTHPMSWPRMDCSGRVLLFLCGQDDDDLCYGGGGNVETFWKEVCIIRKGLNILT